MGDSVGLRTGRKPSRPVFFLAAALLAFTAAPLFPFGFEPITQDFAPSGPGAIQSFTITNPGAVTVAVRISMLSREMDADGVETRKSVASLFLVYPLQAVLAPNSVQAVKIQWKGPADVAIEQNYRTLVEQVPVDFEAAGTRNRTGGAIRVMFRYMGAVYVVPKGAKPDIVLDSAKPSTGTAGRRGLELVFLNRGATHALLGNLRVTVSTKDGSIKREFAAGELAGINGENVLAGHSRRFFLPLPVTLQRNDISVTFRFDPLR